MQVSRKLIENVGELKKALNEISVYDLDVYTSMELYYKIANKLNEVITELMRFEGIVSDEVIKQNEKLIYLLGEGLNTEVVKKINQMIADGTMDTIINHNVFNSLNNKVENYKEELSSQIKDIENKKLDKTGGTISRQLFGSQNNAVVVSKSNVKNPTAPVTPSTLEDIALYGGIDQAIDVNEFWTNDDDGEYVGILNSVLSTTSNTVTISNYLGDYPIEGMIIALYTEIPSKNNMSYIGMLKSVENNIITVDKWVSMTSKVAEIPENVKYAIVGISTKMYVDYNYVRARSGHDWLTSVVGSQMELRNSSQSSMVGYYASLRQDANNKGGVGFRVGTQNDCKFTSAYDLNGQAKYLISMQTGSQVDEILHANGENLIDGNGALNRSWNNASSNTPTPILNITSSTNLSNIGYDKNASIVIRNNSNTDLTLSCNSGNIYYDGVKTSSFTLKGYSTINMTTNGNDAFWLNAGNTIKSVTLTSTTGNTGNISVPATYSNNIVISAESIGYIVLVRKISDRYTICVYNPTSTGLEPVKSTEITYTIHYV